MTPEQLEREAANRIQHMGYDNDLSDAEVWRRLDEDAQLVAASNDVLWERVRKLEAVRDAAIAYLTLPGVAKKDADGIFREVLTPQQKVTKALVKAIALAGGSDG